MTKHLVDLDNSTLSAVRAELGTSTIKDTVNEALNLIVLHYDSDFDSISAVTGQQCQWVIPAGSVD